MGQANRHTWVVLCESRLETIVSRRARANHRSGLSAVCFVVFGCCKVKKWNLPAWREIDSLGNLRSSGLDQPVHRLGAPRHQVLCVLLTFLRSHWELSDASAFCTNKWSISGLRGSVPRLFVALDGDRSLYSVITVDCNHSETKHTPLKCARFTLCSWIICELALKQLRGHKHQGSERLTRTLCVHD